MTGSRAPRWVRVAASVVFGYELVALWSDLPTVSELAEKEPLLAAGIVGGLAVHFRPGAWR